MRIFLAILLTSLALTAQAATYTITTITVTNAPTTNGQTLVINGVTRLWTNNAAGNPALNVTTNATRGGAATNLLNQIASYPPTGLQILSRTNVTNVVLRSSAGSPLTITASGGWASITTDTLEATNSPAIVVPFTVVPSVVRTNWANELVKGIGTNATEAFNADTPALSKFVGLTNGQTLTRKTLTAPAINGGTNTGGVLSNIPYANVSNLVGVTVLLTDGTVTNIAVKNATELSGVVTALTGGVWTNGAGTNWFYLYATNIVARGSFTATNAIIDGLTATNLNSPGSGSLSQQIGEGATATGDESVAYGVSANSAGLESVALGKQANAFGDFSIAIGHGTSASDDRTISIGYAAGVSGNQSLAIGNNSGAANGSISIGDSVSSTGGGVALGNYAESAHTNSVALGNRSLTTTTNQIRLGTSAETVSIPGVLSVESGITNHVTTGTNLIDAEVSYKPRAWSTAISGYASAIQLGTNNYVRITGVAAAVTNASFKGGYAGYRVLVEMANPGRSCTILDHSSIGAPASTEKVNLGTTSGTTSLNSTNDPAVFELMHNGAEWLFIHNPSFR